MSHLRITAAPFLVAIICTLAFSQKEPLASSNKQGEIEGYIIPKHAKPYLKISMPNPKNIADTIHKNVQPNEQGYFKIKNLEHKSYVLIFLAKEKGYKNQRQLIQIQKDSTYNIGRITLERAL